MGSVEQAVSVFSDAGLLADTASTPRSGLDMVQVETQGEAQAIITCKLNRRFVRIRLGT